MINYIKEWILKHFDNIHNSIVNDQTFYFRNKFIASSSNKFSDLTDHMIINLFTHIMRVNRGQFTWSEYDTLCKCEVFDCVVIMIYEDLGNSVQIYYPRRSYSRSWLSNPKNYKIIVLSGYHFEYFLPSCSFENGICAISHLKVTLRSDIIDLTSNEIDVCNNNIIDSEITSTPVEREEQFFRGCGIHTVDDSKKSSYLKIYRFPYFGLRMDVSSQVIV